MNSFISAFNPNTTTVLPFSIVSSQTAVTRALMKGASLVSVSGTCSYCTKKINFVHCFCIQKYTWTHKTLFYPQDFCVANSWISMIRNYNRHKQLPKVQYLILTSIHSNTSSFLAFLFNIRFLSSSCIFAECCVAEPTFCDELTWPRANSIFCRRKKNEETPNSTLSGNKKRILRENSLFHCKKSDMEILNLFT